MNPFDLNSEFNSFIYENVSALNKSGDKQVIESFKILIDSEDHNLSPDNAMVFNAMKKHLASNNSIIRNLASDLLYKFYKNGQSSDNLYELTALWLYKFIENPEHKTGKIIFKKHLKFEDIEKYFLDVLDFENETILALKGFLFLLKTMVGNSEKDDSISRDKYREWFITKLSLFKINSNNILTRIYGVMEYLGPIDEIYPEVLQITAPSLMNNKWSIIFRIYKKIPSEINKDSRYLSPELLLEVVDDLSHTDDLEVKTVENLYIVLKKVNDVESYIRKNLPKVNIKDLCLKLIPVSFNFLDTNFEQSIVNELISSTLKIHNIKQITYKDYPFFKDDSDLVPIIDVDRLREEEDLAKEIEQINLCNKTCPHVGTQENEDQRGLIIREVLASFTHLRKDHIIKRATLLSVPLKAGYFEDKFIVENIADSLKVFKKETFFKKDLNFDKTLVMLKYPEEFDGEIVKSAVEKDFVPFIGIHKFKRVIIEVLKELNIVDLYSARDRADFPEEYDLFFFYKFRSGTLRHLDYEELSQDYLDSIFIRELFNHPNFDKRIFFKSVCNFLSDYKIPITTEYSSPFYDHLPEFYENVEMRKRLKEVEEIRKIYLDNVEDDDEKLLLLCVNEILNLDDYECIISKYNLSLGKNQVFLEKVCKDNKIETGYVCPKTPIESFLMKDNKRTIDYSIRNFEFDVKDLKHVDFSYLSNKALGIVVKQIIEYLEADDTSESSYYSVDSSSEEESPSLKDYLTITEESKYFTITDIIDLMEGDKLLQDEFYKERSEIYAPLLQFLYTDLSNNMINNYSLSKIEKDINQEELFDFVLSGFPTSTRLFWEFLLNSISRIRNTDLVIFIEEMLSHKKSLKMEFNLMDKNLQKLFAFTFPNLYVNISKTKFDLEDLIYQEACNKIENVKCKLNKTSVDYSLKITYLNDSDEFISHVKIPFDYPFKRPIFITNVEKNSLLNLKIAELMRKTSKFMSIISLWKVNIDKKVAGAKECLFCYFILHTTDGSFPEYACIHCNNKFHNRCIERWISSYNKRTCPMCRQPIPIY